MFLVERRISLFWMSSHYLDVFVYAKDAKEAYRLAEEADVDNAEWDYNAGMPNEIYGVEEVEEEITENEVGVLVLK